MTASHGLLMDRVYRRQKHIYDVTRKYYLFGRDRLIAGMAARPGSRVLELGCGTGRNLARIAAVWPGTQLYGLDISHEMLGHARNRLGSIATLAAGDATSFEATALFGIDSFDHVVLSYTLSMIPDWRATLAQAARVVAPGGHVHIVDFGDFAELPAAISALMRGWLRLFHVAPRNSLGAAAARVAAEHGFSFARMTGPFGYYRIVTLTRV